MGHWRQSVRLLTVTHLICDVMFVGRTSKVYKPHSALSVNFGFFGSAENIVDAHIVEVGQNNK